MSFESMSLTFALNILNNQNKIFSKLFNFIELKNLIT